LPERLHLQLLSQLAAILPKNCQAIFLGDGEFDGIQLQQALQTLGLRYVCRTAKNTQLFENDLLFSFVDLHIGPGEQIAACLAYLWIVYLGLVALRKDWVKVIHRADRCDWSLFRLGLALLDHFLNNDLPIPVSFSLMEKNCVR